MKKSKNNNIILGFRFWFQLMQRTDHKRGGGGQKLPVLRRRSLWTTLSGKTKSTQTLF